MKVNNIYLWHKYGVIWFTFLSMAFDKTLSARHNLLENYNTISKRANTILVPICSQKELHGINKKINRAQSFLKIINKLY